MNRNYSSQVRKRDAARNGAGIVIRPAGRRFLTFGVFLFIWFLLCSESEFCGTAVCCTRCCWGSWYCGMLYQMLLWGEAERLVATHSNVSVFTSCWWCMIYEVFVQWLWEGGAASPRRETSPTLNSSSRNATYRPVKLIWPTKWEAGGLICVRFALGIFWLMQYWNVWLLLSNLMFSYFIQSRVSWPSLRLFHNITCKYLLFAVAERISVWYNLLNSVG